MALLTVASSSFVLGSAGFTDQVREVAWLFGRVRLPPPRRGSMRGAQAAQVRDRMGVDTTGTAAHKRIVVIVSIVTTMTRPTTMTRLATFAIGTQLTLDETAEPLVVPLPRLLSPLRPFVLTATLFIVPGRAVGACMFEVKGQEIREESK